MLSQRGEPKAIITTAASELKPAQRDTILLHGERDAWITLGKPQSYLPFQSSRYAHNTDGACISLVIRASGTETRDA